ncbi:hypothetical protein BC835DRAFT_1024916 [Cytidiella melzeri]|nr:hypothetical protein BC835DRAFT_1024916 [Cytidiella melzeri]
MKQLFALVALVHMPFVLARGAQEVLSAPSEESQLGQWNLSFVPPSDWTFPYGPGQVPIKDTSIFVNRLYKGDPKDNKPWISNTPGRDPDVYPWMNQRIGDAELKPDTDAGEYAEVQKNPNWRWSESWRIIALCNTLLTTRAAQKNGNGLVVKEYFSALGKNSLSKAMFPSDVRILLERNEAEIVKAKQPWVGNPVARKPFQPHTKVKVIHGKDVQFAQTGPVGPMSLEASFILATQLAGINWKTLNSQLDKDAKETGFYWVSGIIPEKDKNRDELILEKRGRGVRERTLGYLSRRGAPTTGSPDAGFYIMLDIDPKVNGYTNKDKKVFVFASHVMDQHSRFKLDKPAKLKQMEYVGEYLPEDSKKLVKVIDKKEDKKHEGAGVRFYAHGHGAVLPFHTFMDWLGQKIPNKGPGEAMPKYDQIGEMHLYYLPEDEDSLWPRSTYLATNGVQADETLEEE